MLRRYESLERERVSTGEKKRVFIFVEARQLQVGPEERWSLYIGKLSAIDFRIYVARLLFFLLLLYYSLRRWLTEDEKLTVISLVKKKMYCGNR